MGERNTWAFQVGGRACAKAQKHNALQKPLMYLGRRGREITKALEVMGRSSGFMEEVVGICGRL